LPNVRQAHAQVAAYPDLLAPQVDQARMDDQESPAAQDPQEFQADHHRTATQRHHHHADRAQLDLQDQRDPMDPQVTTDLTENQVAQERKVPPVLQAQLDPQAQQVTMETTDPQETKAKMVPESPRFPESRDPLVKMVDPDPKVPLETPVPMELLVSPDPKVPLDPPVPMEMLDHQAKMVNQVQQVQLVTRVSVPNIAHLMVVFSLKMVPAVKKFA